MHGLAALVMTIAIWVTKPRIRGGIKALFGKSLFCPSDMGNPHLISTAKLAKISRYPLKTDLKTDNVLPCDESC